MCYQFFIKIECKNNYPLILTNKQKQTKTNKNKQKQTI